MLFSLFLDKLWFDGKFYCIGKSCRSTLILSQFHLLSELMGCDEVFIYGFHNSISFCLFIRSFLLPLHVNGLLNVHHEICLYVYLIHSFDYKFELFLFSFAFKRDTRLEFHWQVLQKISF